MKAIIRCGLFFVLLVPCAAIPALADSVKGQFMVEGKAPMKPLEVAAFHVADKGTMVMLTLKPLNREAIAKSSNPESAANNDKAVDDADYIELIVGPDGQVSINAHVGGPHGQYLDSTKMDLIANCGTNTPEHVTCDVKTKKLVKFMDDPGWTFEVTFDAAVTAHKAS